jgi:hypothetical protein
MYKHVLLLNNVIPYCLKNLKWNKNKKKLMGGLDSWRWGVGRLSSVVLVSEKTNLVREMSGKSQGILFISGAGNPVKYTRPDIDVTFCF